MHPTFATLLLVMLAGALVVGSMIGFGRRVGGMRSWGAVLASAAVVGGLFGAVMVYAAIQHNPQGSIVNHDTGAVDYAYLSEIFLSWFLAANIVATLGFATAVALLKGAGFLGRMLLRRVPALRPQAPSSRVRTDPH
jgi:hypothetical protein